MGPTTMVSIATRWQTLSMKSPGPMPHTLWSKGITQTRSTPAWVSSLRRSSSGVRRSGPRPGLMTALGWGSKVIAVTGTPSWSASSRAAARMA